MIGLWEIIGILVLVAIIYFIGKKAPALARNTGKSISEFKRGIKNIPEEVKAGMKEEDEKAAKKTPAKKSTKKTAKKSTKANKN